MNSLPRSNHSSEMKCCGNSGCQTSTMVPKKRKTKSKKRKTKSISSILAKFDEHFIWTYQWYLGSVTFGKAGCGFLLADHHGADKILEATHIINGKEARIGRILFVGGLEETTTAEALKEFFSEHGNVVDHEIALMYRSSIHNDFGIIEFDSDKPVDDLSARGKIDFYGKEVVLKKVGLLRADKPGSWPRGVLDGIDEPLGSGCCGCLYGGTWEETDDEDESDGDNAGDPSPPMDPEDVLQTFEHIKHLLPKKLRNFTSFMEWREAIRVKDQEEYQGGILRIWSPRKDAKCF